MIDSSVGIDPGVTTGMCFLDYEDGKLVGRTLLQCDADSAAVILKGLLLAYYSSDVMARFGKRVASVEKFVTGRGAGSLGAAADVTRQLVMELAETLQMFGYTTAIRPAADVKPWASDKRLVKAQAAKDPKKINGEFRHAMDAARHCLYGAVNSGIAPDPLRTRLGVQLKQEG